MDYAVEVREFEEQRTISKRISVERAELAEKVTETLRETRDYLTARGVEPAGPPYAQYFRFGQTDAELECGWPVAERVPAAGLIQPGKLEGGKAAVALHQGPMDTLVAAHQAAHGYLHQVGTFSNGFPREVYLTSPMDSDDSQEWQTEVIWLMK